MTFKVTIKKSSSITIDMIVIEIKDMMGLYDS
jgi:hypothetical protein